MTPISRFTYRNWLIALHDLLATAAAVVLTFLLRFDGQELWDRLPLLLKILPYFVVFSFFVCYVFQLTTTKWRFISIPDLLNILRASSVLTVALLVLDYIFLAPNVYGTFFLGKTTIVIYWFMEVFFLSGLRLTYRYFRYTRARNRARTGNSSVLCTQACRRRCQDVPVMSCSTSSKSLSCMGPPAQRCHKARITSSSE